MMTQTKKNRKTFVVSLKLPQALVDLLDAEAERVGASRSYVLRRIALEHFHERGARESMEVAS